MTYVVTEPCIKCKYGDCIEICPVDCFYEGQDMVVINPEECIDCGLCAPECPIDAIKSDTDPGREDWVALNHKFAQTWPRITQNIPALPEADHWKDVPDKLALLSPAPGHKRA